MTRRIRAAIVGVSATILLLLGLPLAIAVHQLILNSEVVALQSSATRTLAEVAVPLSATQLAAIGRERDAPPPFTVYDARGNRVFGPGPQRADPLVQRALAGNPVTRTGTQIEAAVPVTDRSPNEQVVGAVRVTGSLRRADERTRLAWLVMAASASAAIAGAWLVGNRLASRLARPLTDLAAAAERIGTASTSTVDLPPPSGISEVDSLVTALGASSDRVNEALTRERQFSVNVSHQLRTPMTALRLDLETARDHQDHPAFGPALADLARLEGTVDHLLAVARDATSTVSQVRPDLVARDGAARWRQPVEAAGRVLVTDIQAVGAARGSSASVSEVLDVLLHNAIHHGTGTIRLTVRPITGGVAVDVSDEGQGIGLGEVEQIFERGHGTGHGIGLSLARSLAEREGARLVVSHLRPITFSLVLHASPTGDHHRSVAMAPTPQERESNGSSGVGGQEREDGAAGPGLLGLGDG